MSVILTHLGDSVPYYLQDCVHQLRLWNKPSDLAIYVLLDSQDQNPFWHTLESMYRVILVDVTNLEATPHHRHFRNNFSGNKEFRSGYWQRVQERFFYLEEFIRERGLQNVISMEYDVLVYGNVAELLTKLANYSENLCYLMDNETRGHPGFMFIPNADELQSFTEFMVSMQKTRLSDMEILAQWSKEGHIKYLPAITPKRNQTTETRTAKNGLFTGVNPSYLSAGFDELGVVFDSAVVGQWLAGIDPRNTGGNKVIEYENESALYSIKEVEFEWKREENLWRPFMDGAPLFTIHVHSKALYCLLSDRRDQPKGDYDVATIMRSLEMN